MTNLQTTYARFAEGLGQLQIIPLLPFGARIIGLDLSQPLEIEQVVAIRTALLEHKMLLLQDQELSPAEQISLTRLFGSELHRAGPSLRYLPDYPEVFRITNRQSEGNPNTGQYWHSDGHYLADPSSITVMHIVNATSDGATLITDACAAFQRLSEAQKQFLSCHAFHAPETGATHPILRPHPVTRRMAMYVNLQARAIDRRGKAAPEVNGLVDQHLSMPGTYYAHQWKSGDTVIVDNFSCAHRGTPSNGANLRVLHRTSVTGPSTWWRLLSV